MKKILLSISIMLGWAMAQALPFVPTSDPTLSTNYWYFLKTEGLYCAGNDNLEIVFRNSADVNNDRYLWCFVNTPNEGYRLYNKGTGCYLQQEGLLYDDSYAYTYYQDMDGTNFYLTYHLSDWNADYYLFMNTYQDAYGFIRYMDVDPERKGVFSVELAKEGTPVPGDPAWTRFDINGVGYGFINGGTGFSQGESSANLCDNNAETKYYGSYSNCWIIMKASSDVAVNQYSIVTASDSRSFYNRSLRSWKLQGSTDGTNWEDIDIQENYPMPFEDRVEVVFMVNSIRKFRFFRFMATNSALIDVQISEVWINEQPHSSVGIAAYVEHGCGNPRTRHWSCNECKLQRFYLSPSVTPHNFNNGICTECGIAENETRLLYNGQGLIPYYVKALHGSRISNNNWPTAPEGWNTVGFDDSNWGILPLPTANPGHSDGPFTLLQYNSYWYDEYNSYWIRRPFSINGLKPNATFRLRCVHDDNMVVYVNGQEVINAEGWTASADHGTWLEVCDSFSIPASAFQEGDNVLAIYMQQNWGGAYFDCELLMGESDAIPGDVNGDGKVNVTDVTALVNMILGVIPKDNAVADLTGDGKVNVSDVTALINIILGVS